jgi:hypothetical protein
VVHHPCYPSSNGDSGSRTQHESEKIFGGARLPALLWPTW